MALPQIPLLRGVGLADVVLLASLIHSSVDVVKEWRRFSTCHWPIHKWLLVSYVTVLVLRTAQLVGARYSSTGSCGAGFLLNLRERALVPSMFRKLTWLLMAPFFLPWLVIGSWMLRDTLRHSPMCFPRGSHPWYVIAAWQAIGYLWVVIHIGLAVAARVLERRCQAAERRLEELERGDDEIRARWGSVGRLSSYAELPSEGCGLDPSRIRQLPEFSATGDDADGECAICLSPFAEGDGLRALSVCGHKYHRACIDLWLLRSGDCPLCKAKVPATQGKPKVE